MNFGNFILPAILLLLALRIWRTGGRERRIRASRLWILPAIVSVLIGVGLISQPVTLSFLTVDSLVVAFVAGFGFGWLRGRTTHISVDPESGELRARSTPVALVMIAALILVRLTARDWLNANAEAWQIEPAAIVDGFLLFGMGLVIGWRVEMMLRCRRLMSDGAEDTNDAAELPADNGG